MKTSSELERSDIEKVIAAALGAAAGKGWNVSVAVVDAGGHLLGFARADGANPASARIAIEKARTAATFRVPTGGMEDRIVGRPGMMVLPGATPLRGGLPLKHGDGVVGGIGISGLAPAQDEEVARAGAGTLA